MNGLLRYTMGVLLPLALIFIGLLILTGCIYIPTFDVTVHRKDVGAKVGDAQSEQPIRIASATRAQVIAMFGQPPYQDDSRRRIGYAWSVKNGVRIYPFCFASTEQIEDRGVELDFDEHDVLRRFTIVGGGVHDEGSEPGLMASMPNIPYTGRPSFDQSLHPNDEDLQRLRDDSIGVQRRRHLPTIGKPCPTAPTSSTN